MFGINKNRKLRWQHAVGVATGFFALPFLILAVFIVLGMFGLMDNGQKHAATPPKETMGFLAAAIVLTGSTLGLFVWAYRLDHRPDLEPDVLRDIVSEDEIFIDGPVHFSITALARPETSRIVVLCQNRFDSPARFAMNFHIERGSELIPLGIPGLSLVLEGSALAVATADVFASPRASGELKVRLTIDAGHEGPVGREVRFRPAQGISTKIHPGATAAIALTGTIVWGGGTYLTLSVHNPSDTHRPLPTWESTNVWTPASRADIAEVRAQLKAFVQRPLA